MTSKVQDVTNTASSGSSIAVTISASGAGNTLIVSMSSQDTTASSIATTGGTSYTWVKDISGVTGTQDAEIWRGTGGSGATTVTVTLAGTTVSSRADVTEWTGYLNLDNSSSATGSTASIISPTITQIQGSELFIEAGRSLSTSSSLTGTGWAFQASGSGNASAYAYLISTDSASHSVTFTLAGSAAWVSVAASYFEVIPRRVLLSQAIARSSR